MGTGEISFLLYSNILLWEMRKKIVFKMRYWASQVVPAAKNPPANAEDMMQLQSLGPEDPLEEAWQPLQYSGLENPMDRGAWQASVHRVAKSWMRLQ